jgi:hypothetical protein
MLELTERARLRGWSDAEWSRRSGVSKETLCRLRSRSNCDLATLAALATAVDAELNVRSTFDGTTTDGRWPVTVDRALESRLLHLVAMGTTRPEDWRTHGPGFFLAGLAMVLASVPGFDRRRHVVLAEALHPGASEPRVFAQWLETTPLPPSRFLPMIQGNTARAA